MKPKPRMPSSREIAISVSFQRLQISRMVIELMLHQGVTHHELARRVKKPLRWVNGFLGASRDTNLRDLSNVLTALNSTFKATFVPQKQSAPSPGAMKEALEQILRLLPKKLLILDDPRGRAADIQQARQVALEGLKPVKEFKR